MLDAGQLRHYVIRPALQHLSLWSEGAEDLVIGTWAVESRLTYLHQIGGGPALGLAQMEPNTHDDIWANYLRYRQPLGDAVMALAPARCLSPDPYVRVDSSALIASLWYAAGMTRIHYRRSPDTMPAAGDWNGMAELWKRHYNSASGAGTPEKFLQAIAACGIRKT